MTTPRFVLALLMPLGACAVALAAAETSAPSVAGLDFAKMDRSLNPGDAFYDYANGAWLKNAEIPADRTNIGAGYDPTLETSAANSY